MKTGTASHMDMRTDDKTLILAMTDLMLQEILSTLSIISEHNRHITTITPKVAIKCMAYVILHPKSIGIQLNRLLEIGFIGDEERDPQDSNEDLKPIMAAVFARYNKHHERLMAAESNYNGGTAPRSDLVTKPLISAMIGDYIRPEGNTANGDSCDEDDEGDEGDEGDDGEERDMYGFEDLGCNEEQKEQTIISCCCTICSSVLNMEHVDPATGCEQHPFMHVMLKTLKTMQDKYA